MYIYIIIGLAYLAFTAITVCRTEEYKEVVEEEFDSLYTRLIYDKGYSEWDADRAVKLVKMRVVAVTIATYMLVWPGIVVFQFFGREW